VNHILIKCPQNLRPVRTGLTTDMIIFETLPLANTVLIESKGPGISAAQALQSRCERLEPDEITVGVIVTILGAFLTRVVAIARGMKGWPYV